MQAEREEDEALARKHGGPAAPVLTRHLLKELKALKRVRFVLALI